MIRAHAVSHQKTKDTSPVSWFVERMAAIRDGAPDTLFYVSCDVPEVQEEICSRFGNCVAQREKGSYNSVAGVKSAVVDLYLLANSSFMLAPHFSSFLHIARHLGRDRVPFETPVTPPRAGFREVSLGMASDPVQPWLRN